MTEQTEMGIDRALLRELARLSNLLRQLLDDVQRGALRGEPLDALDVMRVIKRIELRLNVLGEPEREWS